MRKIIMSKIGRFIDIGANLTDSMYQGVYNGGKKHEPDLEQVLQRGWDTGLQRLIVTGGSLAESREALRLANNDVRLYSTVGCHPTRCNEFDDNGMSSEDYLESLRRVIAEGKEKVVAIGEIGLDYEREKFCPKDVQQKYLEMQLRLCQTTDLPLFLHCRKAASDLYNILSRHTRPRAVVHSFDGTLQEANQFIQLGYFIGINGCSLKTKENLETVAALPRDKILIETDCPWCEVRPTHAGYPHIAPDNLSSAPSVKKEKWKPGHMVKGRNEPRNIRQIVDIIAAIRKEDPVELGETIYENTISLFWPNEVCK